jgi:hypothetical protein
MVAFDRAAMIAGSPAPQTPIVRVPRYAGRRVYVFGTLPADLDGPAPAVGTPDPFVMAWDNGTTDKIVLFSYHVDWATRTNSSVTVTSLPSAQFNQNLCNFGSNFACLREPSPGERLDSLAGEMMFRNVYHMVGRGPRLLANFTVNVGSGRAGIRWYELSRSTTGWRIRQEGTYATSRLHRWMGSLAQDKNGDIALGYSVTSATTRPGIRYAGRLWSDPLSRLPRAEAVMEPGGGVQTNGGNRWGDYSNMSLDPSDNCTFWYTNEYYASTSRENWSTRIGHFRFPSCS